MMAQLTPLVSQGCPSKNGTVTMQQTSNYNKNNNIITVFLFKKTQEKEFTEENLSCLNAHTPFWHIFAQLFM